MKIYNEIVIDMNPESSSYKETLYEDSYEYKGNAPELRLTANRQEVVSAMVALQDAGFKNIKPRDVFKHCGYKAQSKDATRIQKTMERMRQDGQLRIGEENLYGTYRYVDNKKSSF